MQTQTPILSIVVGTLDRCDQLRRAVDSIVRETRIPYRLYITDAGSTDGTISYLESIRSEHITPVLVGQRLGQARAYNDVFQQVDTPYVCWLSDDNEVVNRGLDRAVEVLRGDQTIGLVGLKVRDVVGPFAKAAYIGGVSKYGILNVNQGVLPTRALREVGYFSEEFRDYGIDPDLTAKVLLAGYDVVYTRNIALHHFRNWETDQSSPDYAKMQERQRRYLALYAKTYGNRFAFSVPWLLKRAAWKALRTSFGISVDSPGSFLGLGARDWSNCLASRYISVRRELTGRHPLYHLRQTPTRSANSRPQQQAVR